MYATFDFAQGHFVHVKELDGHRVDNKLLRRVEAQLLLHYPSGSVVSEDGKTLKLFFGKSEPSPEDVSRVMCIFPDDVLYSMFTRTGVVTWRCPSKGDPFMVRHYGYSSRVSSRVS